MAYSKEVAVATAFIAVFSMFLFFGPVASGFESVVFGDGWEEPEPSVESVEVAGSGCHEDVRGMSMSSTDGTWIGTVNGTFPHTQISAEIRLVSPGRADACRRTDALVERNNRVTRTFYTVAVSA